MQPLFDMHCHYGFAPNCKALVREVAAHGVGAYSCGVTPFDPMPLERDSMVRFGLGLHPWWVADGRCGGDALERFAELAPSTPYIGEIGLDFGKKCMGFEDSSEKQIAAFAAVLRACEGERKLLSVHAVKSASVILDMLAESPQDHDVIFHWFSGTSDELARAIKAGCFFSINPHMLETKRGREYARVIPAGQLLLETDAPAEEDSAYSAVQQRVELESVLSRLAEIRSVTAEELGAVLAATSERLLRRS